MANNDFPVDSFLLITVQLQRFLPPRRASFFKLEQQNGFVTKWREVIRPTT